MPVPSWLVNPEGDNPWNRDDYRTAMGPRIAGEGNVRTIGGNGGVGASGYIPFGPAPIQPLAPMLGLIRDQPQAPVRGGGGGGGSSGGGGGGGARAGHAVASLARAEYIDTNDPIYQLTAPKPWMSGMLARGKEYLGSATEDAIRLMSAQAARQGVSMSSPASQYMVAMQRRDQQKALANALRDANLAWTLPAADRRHSALGNNSQVGTNVSMGNADALTRVSMANAGYDTQASLANAGFASEASLQNARLGQAAWIYQTDFAANQRQQQLDNLFRFYNAPGSGDPGPPQSSWTDYANAAIQGGISAYETGQGINNLRQPTTPRAGGTWI